ncbi:MAG TPA: hypothetical protein VF179_08565 [Thermoanaerobaculia bacterium]|nr:hypothetical protein [Thermoanaerobaculia bacterium]
MRAAAILMLAAVLIACQGVSSSPAGSPSAEVVVDKLEIAVAQSFPVQVRLLVEGYLAEACGLAEPVVELRGDTFFVELHGSGAAGTDCEKRQRFSRRIPLPVHGLKKGVYKVVAEGRETSFTLSQDNVLAAPPPPASTHAAPPPPPAPTAGSPPPP